MSPFAGAMRYIDVLLSRSRIKMLNNINFKLWKNLLNYWCH